MNFNIDPDRLRELRTSPIKGPKLSQEALARKAKLTKRQIQRIEGENRPLIVREKTIKGLADALNVSIQVLSGEEEIPTQTSRPTLINKSSMKIDSNVMLNFDLLEKAYGVTFENVLNIAPALFAIHAELSLRWRTKRFKKKINKCLKVMELKDIFPGLDSTIGGLSDEMSDHFTGTRTEEEASIKNRDIYGVEREFYEDSLDTDDENPFAQYLRNFIDEKNLGDAAILDSVGEGLPIYLPTYLPDGKTPKHDVCRQTLNELAGGNSEAIFALRIGATRIKNIPIDLLAKNRSVERGHWLVDQAKISNERNNDETIK